MRIVDQILISEAGWFVPSPDGAEEVKPYQIVVLVSIAGQELAVLPDDALRFPAILDTGNNHNFVMRQAHLERWAPMILPEAGRVEIGTFAIPLLAANVWGTRIDRARSIRVGNRRSAWSCSAASSSIHRKSPILSGCPYSVCAP